VLRQCIACTGTQRRPAWTMHMPMIRHCPLLPCHSPAPPDPTQLCTPRPCNANKCSTLSSMLVAKRQQRGMGSCVMVHSYAQHYVCVSLVPTLFTYKPLQCSIAKSKATAGYLPPKYAIVPGAVTKCTTDSAQQAARATAGPCQLL
jgi:hypothetical protein